MTDTTETMPTLDLDLRNLTVEGEKALGLFIIEQILDDPDTCDLPEDAFIEAMIDRFNTMSADREQLETFIAKHYEALTDGLPFFDD